MALTRITKGVIKPNENYDTHNINSTGIVTAIGLDVNGNGDISGNLSIGGVLTYEDVTSIDSVGIITARDGIDCNGDIDVDGHTNLDNVSVAGITTMSSTLNVSGVTNLSSELRANANIRMTNAGPKITFIDDNHNPDYEVGNYDGVFRIRDATSSVNRLTVSSTGNISILKDLDVDGHTNLDNGSVAGIVTFNSGSALHTNGGQILLYDRPDGNSNNLFFGTGGRAVAYHDGTGFSIVNNTGHAYIGVGAGSKDLYLYAQASGNVLLQQNTGVRYVKGVGSDASVQLFFNNNLRLNTTTAGVSIPKDLDVDGHTNLDNVSIAGFTTFAQNINVTGSVTGTSLVLNAGSPTIFLNDTDTNSDFSIQCNGGLLKFMDTTNSYAVRLSINSSGNVSIAKDLDVDGHTNLDNVSVAGVTTHADNASVKFGTDGDFYINHSGSSLGMLNTTGDTLFRNTGGAQYFDCNQISLRIAAGSQTMLNAAPGGVTLYTSNDAKLATTNNGVSLPHDLDVDGHTNLDNVSVAGITTFSNGPIVPNGQYYRGIINSGSQQKIVGGYISGTDTLRLGESMYLTSNGLGIGESSPEEELHITAATPVIRLEDSDTSRQSQIVGIDGNLRFDADNNNAQANTNISFRTDGTERVRIASNGLVSIDHASGSTLQLTRTATNTTGLTGKIVFGNMNWDSSMASIQSYQDGANDNGSLRFYTQAAVSPGEIERLRITSAGRVGIGSDIPVAHLDVASYQNIEVLRLRDRHFNKYLTIRGGGSPNRMIIDSYEGGGGGAAIDLASNGDTKVRIDSAGRMGIGENSPGSYSSGAYNLVISAPSGSNSGITINSASGGTDSGAIFFSHGTASGANGVGRIRYYHSDDHMDFYTANAERLRITSDGQLNLGSRTAIGIANSTTTPTHFRISRSDDAGAPLITMGAHEYAQSTSAPGAVISSNHRDFIITKFHPNFTGNSPGFWLKGNEILMHSGGSETLRLSSNSKVGINETSPENELHIAGTTGTSAGGLLRLDATSGDNFIILDNTSDSSEWVFGNDSGSRDEFRMYYNSGSGYGGEIINIDGTTNNGVVTIDGGTSTLVRIKGDSAGTAGLRCGGDSGGSSNQCTGYVEVHQDGSHGGGMFYNGDGTPSFATYEGADYFSLFRLSSGTRYSVMRWVHNSNDCEVQGNMVIDNGHTGNNSTLLTVRGNSAGTAGVRAGGDSSQTQCTGFVEVHQDEVHGGGIFYNGDGSPAFATDESADRVTFYRMHNGARYEVFSCSYHESSIRFRGDLRPATDNNVDLGSSSLRWRDVYCNQGAFNNSDEVLKQDIASLTTTEMNVAKRLSGLFKTYRWKDAVEEKGTDKARTHTGIIAQQIVTAMEAEGLDYANYGFIGYDEWYQNAKGETITLEDANDNNLDGYEKIGRYSVRYTELLSFIAAYNDQRFTDLESRVAALEG